MADFAASASGRATGFLLALALAMAAAALTSTVTGLPLALTLLAYSPGGLDAMTIMALASLDPAYVARIRWRVMLGWCW